MDEVIALALLPRSDTILLPEIVEPAATEEMAAANAEDQGQQPSSQPSL
jgi:hypothetical protein